MRDPNVRMLMSGLVEDSPMYDYVEQIAGRQPTQNIKKPVKTKEQIRLEQAQRELEMQERGLDESIPNIGAD